MFISRDFLSGRSLVDIPIFDRNLAVLSAKMASRRTFYKFAFLVLSSFGTATGF